jgi:hypothetical protein
MRSFLFDIRKSAHVGLVLKHAFHSHYKTVLDSELWYLHFPYSPWLLPSFLLVAWFSLKHVTIIYSKMPVNYLGSDQNTRHMTSFFYLDFRESTHIGLVFKHAFHSTLQKLFLIQNKATINFTYSPWLLHSLSLVAWFSLKHVTLIYNKMPVNYQGSDHEY